MRLKSNNIFSRFGSRTKYFLLVAGLTTGLMAGCKQDEDPLFSTPYKGEIIKDERGIYFQANTVILGVQENVSTSDVENMISEFGGQIYGWSKTPYNKGDSYDIFVPADQRELAIAKLKLNPQVRYASRNSYEFADAYDNDQYDTFPKYSTEYKCSFSRHIDLSPGLDLVRKHEAHMKPVSIAIIEIGGFITDTDQINYSDKKYHRDFGEENKVTDNVSVGALDKIFLNHSTVVSQVAAAKDDGKLTNGVAPGFTIVPIKIGSLTVFKDGDILHPEQTNTRKLLKALQHVELKADEANIKVVNLSLSAISPVSSREELIKQYTDNNRDLVDVLKRLQSKGIIVVVAAGNDNNEACGYAPSALDGTIAVGGISYNEDQTLEGRWPDSNYSKDFRCLTISAPAPVLSDYVAIPDIRLGKVFSCQAGTSTAAPQVSGLVALIKAFRPDATYDEVVKLLVDNADSFFNPVIDKNPETRGIKIQKINVRKTIEAVTRNLDNDSSADLIRRCKWTEVNSGSILADAYGFQAVLQNNFPIIYDLQNNQIEHIPSISETCTGTHISLPSMWANEVLFECKKRNDGTARIFKYSIGESNIFEIAAPINYRPYLNYWNGNIAYLGFNSASLYYHRFDNSSMIPINIPTLSGKTNSLGSTFGSPVLLNQTDIDFRYSNMLTYDEPNGFRFVSNLQYKSNSYISSPHNNQVIVFDKENAKIYLVDLTNLTSKTLQNLPPEHIYYQAGFNLPIQFYDGKLASMSADNKIYVWDVNTETQFSSLQLPQDAVNVSFILKGGRLILFVIPAGNIGNILYSCDLK